MKDKMTLKDDPKIRAEAALKSKKNPCTEGSGEDVRQLIHQLLVHQGELQLQTRELRNAQARLADSCKHYADLYDFAPVGNVTFDRNGTIRQANLTTARLFGIYRSQLIDQCFRAFIAEASQPTFDTFLEGIFASKSKASCELELATRANATQTVRIEAAVPEFGEECHAVLLDITERKRAEKESEKREGQRRHEQTLESVGRLAGGVAHDLNNMMCVIIGHIELALERINPAGTLYRDLQKIWKAAYRSADLTRQLLIFARKQLVCPKVLDLNETVSSTMMMLRQVIGENIDLFWIPGQDLGKVKIDPSQVDLLLANFVVNARDALQGAGSITLATENVTVDDSHGTSLEGFAAGEYVLLSLSDTGSGMEQEVLEHIFEPFFTTKEVGQGTGMGLAAVYGIVRQNNGFIDVHSTPGRGTTFEIYLPRCETSADSTSSHKSVANTPAGIGTILMAEDDDIMLNLRKTNRVAYLEKAGVC